MYLYLYDKDKAEEGRTLVRVQCTVHTDVVNDRVTQLQKYFTACQHDLASLRTEC